MNQFELIPDWEVIEFDILEYPDIELCWNCKKVPKYYSIDFHACFCSAECLQNKVNEFIEACKKCDNNEA